MKDDLILINLMIQSHEGILNLEKDQLKSEYAKERYDDLKNIGPGIPVTWNRTELRVIGDELEDMLSGSEKIVRGVEGFNDNKRNVLDLKQKYQSYAFELNNKSLKNIRQKARFIQAMKQILAEVDYLRENNRTDKTQETFLKSTKEGGVLSGVGSMNMKTPDEYMDKYIKEAEARYLKAEDSYAENQTPVRKRNLDEAFKTFEEVNATFDELVRNKDFKRNPTEEMYRIKVKAKMEDFEMEEISDEEWKAFKDQGIVSVGRLQSISKKILEKESLNDKEKEIYDDRKVQIEKGLDAEVTYLPEVSDEEWEAFTAETPVIHGDRLDDIAKKIKNGVTLSDREQDMRKALASEIEDILQKMIKAEKEVNAETKESESSEEAMEETSDSEDGGGEGSEKEKKEHLDDPITLVRKETLKAIEKGEFYVTELDNAQNILKYPELNGEYEYYTTTDPAVGFGAVTMYKFKKKGESLIMGPDGKPVKSGESEVEKVAKTPEPATPEVISSKKPGSIETKVEDVTIENLLEKKSSEITKDEWELLDQIKKDFEKKATADDLEKIDKEISNLDARIIPQPKGDFDLNNLETDYAKILYKKSESANSNRLTYRHLETVRDGLKAFSEKKRKSLDTTKEVAVEKSERESFDDKFIEDQIRDTLKGIGAIREIKNLKIEGVGDTISINTSIKAKKGPISTNVDLKADIENTKDGIGIKDGYSIKASSMEGIVKNLIEPNIKNISSSIKDHIEKEKGKKVEKIWIEDGKLKVEYSNK